MHPNPAKDSIDIDLAAVHEARRPLALDPEDQVSNTCIKYDTSQLHLTLMSWEKHNVSVKILDHPQPNNPLLNGLKQNATQRYPTPRPLARREYNSKGFSTAASLSGRSATFPSILLLNRKRLETSKLIIGGAPSTQLVSHLVLIIPCR